ncbi:MAG: glycosyltransferase [Tetrasphaera sp.]|nr:glycosyltransferase [Tetrasphaera sp.]
MSRILLVLGTSSGGVGAHVRSLAQGLAGAGRDVVLAAPPAVLDGFDMAATGARVVPIELSDRPRRSDAGTLAQLGRLGAEVDLVHAHGLRAGALAVLGARGRTPVIVTLHNGPPQSAPARAIHAALEATVARGAALVLVVSPDLGHRLRRLRAHAIRPAVIAAPPRRAPASSRHVVRAGLDLAPHTSLALTVARLAPQKDLPTLIRAAARLRDLDLTVAVAGDGPLRGHLQALIDAEQAPVRLLGARSDVPDLLAAADVVASSALWEGQPVALQEALLEGAAIVATDAGGTAAVLGDAGLLVPVGDPEALATALRMVLTDGTVRDNLRSRARERADDLPSVADALGAALTAYQSVGVARRR